MYVKKRILFWIDDGHIQFGVSKYIQEKSSFDIYAIYDVNHITKRFYQKQNLVNFKKFWFWRDFQSSIPHEPDMDYLNQFEKTYGINLWSLAYSERKFFKYNEFKKFSSKEILSVTEDECRIFEKILDEVKPDFIFNGITDLHRNVLFSTLCRSKNIPNFMLWPSRTGNRFIISSNYDEFDKFDETNIDWNDVKHDDLASNFLQDNDPRKSVEKKFVKREQRLGLKLITRHLKFILFICNDEYRKFYENWGKTRMKFIFSKEFPLVHIIKRIRREKIP